MHCSQVRAQCQALTLAQQCGPPRDTGYRMHTVQAVLQAASGVMLPGRS